MHFFLIFIVNLDRIYDYFWDISALSIDGDIIIIGGSIGSTDTHHTSLYKLSCANGVCNWSILPQELESPRGLLVAMVVPDDFFDCFFHMCQFGMIGTAKYVFSCSPISERFQKIQIIYTAKFLSSTAIF